MRSNCQHVLFHKMARGLLLFRATTLKPAETLCSKQPVISERCLMCWRNSVSLVSEVRCKTAVALELGHRRLTISARTH